jgi:hypothetical protein
VQQINDSLDSTLHTLLKSPEQGAFVSLMYPPFFRYVCNKAQSAEEILPLALDIRNTSRAAALRAALSGIEHARLTGNNRELHAISREFHKLSTDLSSWLKSKEIEIYPVKLLRLLGISIGIFDNYMVSLKAPSVLWKPFFPGKPHLALLRDLTADLLEVYALGQSYERLFRWGV